MNMNNILMFAMMMDESAKNMNKQTLADIQEEWERSKDYPRKKKKKVRKDLEFRRMIFSHNPYDFMSF